MKISFNWLKQYVDISETPEELGEILTGTGLEVESIEKFESIPGGLNGLVIGEVLTCKPHPNADKLSLTTVDIGNSDPSQIVCGAPNVAVGQKVIVATIGSTLYPASGDPFEIKKAKIRGELSEGMICAEDEIGVGESHDGIMVLDTKLANGTPAAAHFKVENDYVFEIGLTPNRADAASHIGVARDIKAYKNSSLQWPAVELFKVENKSLEIPVEVVDTEGCPRFSGVSIAGVTVKPSPDWLQNRLKAIGLTPINNIVDVTNFICHELGQPLHAYDADQVKGNKIVVKTMPEGTKFITLDEKERKLTAHDLMVCNAEEGMCIAGVFGGAKSGVTDKTKSIFLEGAYWNPSYIRRTGTHHQLKTDASFRFERGTDPNLTAYAVKRAALLIKEIAGGTISSELVDVYPRKIENNTIEVKFSNINRLIGKAIPIERVVSILESLDITIEMQDDIKMVVSVPPYRVDVTQEADIIEEVLRIYGFNNIPLSETTSTGFFADFPKNDINAYRRIIGEQLAANGFYEILTNSLTNSNYQQKHKLSFEGETIEVLNKLSEELGILRQTMVFTGLEVCAYNINRKQKDLKLFEFGKTYHKIEGKYEEQERLALFMTGNLESENWRQAPKKATYFDLSQQVSMILQKSNLHQVSEERINDQIFEYGMLLKKGNAWLGKIGKVKNALVKDFGLKQEIFYAELNTALLFKSANPKLVIEEVPKYPEVRRDLSLVLDRQVTFAEIEELVLATEKKLIKELIAFDVYEGKNIPEGKKAYALGFILLDRNKTLTDKEIDKTMQKLMSAFEDKMGALIRK
ncbi:MAG: phenylalanine--tRNA ligase subunit beta [Cyclobacteriaceae bacterium]